MGKFMFSWIHAVSTFLLVPTALAATISSRTSNKAASPTIDWISCPSEIPPGVECGSIDVPLAYKRGKSLAAEGNETVSLFLTRLKSKGVSAMGPLFFNPGGPGVPVSPLISAGLYVPNLGFSMEVRDAYDIVGLDPRGVGYSSPIRCDPAIFNERVPTLVEDGAGYEALVKHNRRLGASCANLTGPLLYNMDTIHVVKDHELVRRALNAPKFNYFGMSYGSLLGSQYMELFPKQVGRMALDALVDHSQPELDTLLTEATTYETTLNRFFEWCDSNTICALHGNNSKEIFDEVLIRADTEPIPAPSCEGTCQPNVTGEDIRYNVQDFLEFYDLPLTQNWIGLGRAILEAKNGNATLLSTSLATSETSVSQQGSPFAYLAIGCQDWEHKMNTAGGFKKKLQAVKKFAPQTAGASQSYLYQSSCIGWPAPLTNRQKPLKRRQTKKAPPVLLSHSTYDPSCSPVWARRLKDQLPSAVSITRNGFGHTSHFLLGETRAAIDRYLATGKLPYDGTVYQT